jgi:hypothetical protein
LQPKEEQNLAITPTMIKPIVDKLIGENREELIVLVRKIVSPAMTRIEFSWADEEIFLTGTLGTSVLGLPTARINLQGFSLSNKEKLSVVIRATTFLRDILGLG